MSIRPHFHFTASSLSKRPMVAKRGRKSGGFQGRCPGAGPAWQITVAELIRGKERLGDHPNVTVGIASARSVYTPVRLGAMAVTPRGDSRSDIGGCCIMQKAGTQGQ